MGSTTAFIVPKSGQKTGILGGRLPSILSKIMHFPPKRRNIRLIVSHVELVSLKFLLVCFGSSSLGGSFIS